MTGMVPILPAPSQTLRETEAGRTGLRVEVVGGMVPSSVERHAEALLCQQFGLIL
jgi:hypothetical protein